jgi:uroporphyrinogen decarboxylase
MTPRERVHAALRREPVDRIPVFLWLHPVTVRRLSGLLEVPPSRLADCLGDDVRQTWVGNNYAMEGITHAMEGDTHTDDWGIEWVRVGEFNQILRAPLQDAAPAAVRSYSFPYESVEGLLANMATVASLSPRYFVGCDISPCLFEMICRLRGMEQAILDLAEDPLLAAHLLHRAAAFGVRLGEEACRRFPLDWLWTGDDVAGQRSMIMSPSIWRAMIKPHLRQIVQVGKAHRVWVAYHCCGAVRPIIPDLIEIGIDVLNPVQCDCPGMDARDLKREFGRNLAFMGGVDTVDLLPNGSPHAVRGATEELLEIMTGDGGGYILAASHTVPPETPTENIFALYAAAGIPKEEIFDAAAGIRKGLASGGRGEGR